MPATPVQSQSPRWLWPLALIAVALSNLAFIGLGMLMEYPTVLADPGVAVRRLQTGGAGTWSLFAALTLAAGALAPVAIVIARRQRSLATLGRALGVAASVVQVLGLSRWLLVAPTVDTSSPAAVHAFEQLSQLLGTWIGEVGGYALTAAWTLVVVRTLPRPLVPRWLQIVGVVAAVAISLGILIPFGAEWADLVNLAGYILWSVWLLVLTARLSWRRHQSPQAAPGSEERASGPRRPVRGDQPHAT